MRNLSIALVNAATNVTGVSAAIDSNQIFSASFVASFSDAAAAGTLQIQCSNDVAIAGDLAPFAPTNWVNVPGATATAGVATGANAVVYLPPQFVAKWLRISWTRSAGVGTYTVNADAQAI